jgi:pimeloyl-ACP methyl ester carboxylesterase
VLGDGVEVAEAELQLEQRPVGPDAVQPDAVLLGQRQRLGGVGAARLCAPLEPFDAAQAGQAGGFRVVTFDGRGNGRSDRPSTGYQTADFVGDALCVLEAAGVQTAAVVGLSAGSRWGTQLAAEHPERVSHLVLIGPTSPSGARRNEADTFHAEPPDVEGWHKYNAVHWRRNYRDFVEFFSAQITNQPHSTKQIEDTVGWALGTTPEVLIATVDEGATPHLPAFAAAVRCPVLIVHGTDDAVTPSANAGAFQTAILHARLVRLEHAGHGLVGRRPVKFNLLLHAFLDDARPCDKPLRRTATRTARRAIFVSSPIGLGHIGRDLAIADALRRLVPDLEIDWLAQDPVSRVLQTRGERSIHSAQPWPTRRGTSTASAANTTSTRSRRGDAWMRSWSPTSWSSTTPSRTRATTCGSPTRAGTSTTSSTNTRSSRRRRTPG